MRKTLGSLSKNVAIYGMGDVAISVVSLLLLPLYIRHLTKSDYGALALLGGVEALAKITFRWGLDGAFMRYYFERQASATLPRLASTLFLFLLGATGIVASVALLASPVIARGLFGDTGYLLPLRLLLVNTFLLTFTFLPFHVMRMHGEAVTFSAFALGRSSATLVLRLVLVVWAGWGITGLMAADLIVTIALMPLLWPWCRPILRLSFSVDDLRTCLRFGLPRLPHGLAQQALDAGNKFLLSRYLPLSSLGVYQIGVTLGQSLKFFLSAFETGWAPFYYETGRQPGAKVTFSKITTYGIAVLALLVAGVTAVAHDLVLLLARDHGYAGAAIVVPLIALGIAFQGVYLLTSIGLNLTSQTKYYPAATFAAAGAGLGSGVVLMPLFGVTGAAVSFLLSYITLAAVAGFLANRHYPIRYETGRIARLVAAAAVAAAVALALPGLPPLAALLVRGTTTVAVFAGLLWAGGFMRPTERALVAALWDRARGAKTARPEPSR